MYVPPLSIVYTVNPRTQLHTLCACVGAKKSRGKSCTSFRQPPLSPPFSLFLARADARALATIVMQSLLLPRGQRASVHAFTGGRRVKEVEGKSISGGTSRKSDWWPSRLTPRCDDGALKMLPYAGFFLLCVIPSSSWSNFLFCRGTDGYCGRQGGFGERNCERDW